MTNIEILYFDGCPNHERVLEHLPQLLEREQIAARVDLLNISTEDQAEHERFLGSPTVRVNGRDIDPGAGNRTDFGLKCRIYQTTAGLSGTPPDEWLLAALRDAQADLS